MPISGQRKPRAQRGVVTYLFVGLVAFFINGGAGFAQGAPEGVDQRLIAPVTEGRGPHEKVVRFEVAPDAERYRLPAADIEALVDALESGNAAARRAAQVDLGMKAFGTTQGAFGAIGTLAEHAAYMKSFSRVNTALNNIGLVVALAQVGRDVANGDTQGAVIGSLKAFVNYAVGKWGSSALQIAGVASFVVDVTLSEWQAGLTEIGKDVWACRYRAYYAAHGMSVSDWKKKALELYQAAEKSGDIKAFDTYLDAAVNEYVSRAFKSGALELYSECNGSSFGDTRTIQQMIEDEHKGVLNQMLVDKVLPEIADYAWSRSLAAEVARANLYLRPELNQTWRLEVTAYGAAEDTRLVMPLPRGGEWGGKLRADGTFRAEISYYALMKAGFPDQVRLESAAGAETRELIIADGRLTAVFGMPATPFVARYRIEEGEQACQVTRLRQGEAPEHEAQTRPAAALEHLDIAVTGDGTIYLGAFDGQVWRVASPGRWVDNATLFGPPWFEHIQSLENCSFDMFSAGRLAEGDCTIERFESKAVSARTVVERLCRSSAQISMAGIFAAMGSEMTYYGLDTPEGRAVITALRQAMGEGIPGLDASGLHISPPSNP